MLKNSLCALFLFLSMASILRSQSEEVDFATYLFQNKLFDDLIQLLDSSQTANLTSQQQYYLGWAYYRLKELSKSAQYLQKLPVTSPNYQKAQFFAAYNYLYTKQYDKSKQVMASFQVDTNYQELYAFQQAGLHLLKWDLNAYQQQQQGFTYANFHLVKEQKILDELHLEMQDFNPKSPWLAGVLSAIVPGVGKMYAGKTGSGITSLFTVGLAGLITYENYRKDGFTNWKTLLFGSIFTVFYVGNIYGSVYAVKDYRDDFKKKLEHRIMFNLHVPLRSVFR